MPDRRGKKDQMSDYREYSSPLKLVSATAALAASSKLNDSVIGIRENWRAFVEDGVLYSDADQAKDQAALTNAEAALTNALANLYAIEEDEVIQPAGLGAR